MHDNAHDVERLQSGASVPGDNRRNEAWTGEMSEPVQSEDRGLDGFVHDIAGLGGVERVAVLDRSGRVLSASGFPDRDELMEAATLAAGTHAAGARLGDAVSDPGSPRILISGESNGDGPLVLLASLPVRAGIPLLLVLVADGLGPEALAIELAGVSGRVTDRADLAAPVTEPEAFEASLLESLDRLFPRE